MKRRRIVLWAVGILVLLLGAFFLLTSGSPDRYAFLEGRRPSHSLLAEVFGVYELRVYEWDGDYETVKKAVKSESNAAGFAFAFEKKEPFRSVEFQKDKDSLTVIEGRAPTQKDLFANKFSLKGVTVVVSRELPDGWLTDLRLKIQRPLRPLDEP